MESTLEQTWMLLDQGAVQSPGNVGDRNRIIQTDVAREIDFNDIVGGAQALWECAINVGD